MCFGLNFCSIYKNFCYLRFFIQIFHSFESQILTDLQQSIELIDLCEFSPNDKWSLLYRGTRDGFDSNDFHSRCDGHANTLTILKGVYNSKMGQFR
jgi:hypothetical protein